MGLIEGSGSVFRGQLYHAIDIAIIKPKTIPMMAVFVPMVMTFFSFPSISTTTTKWHGPYESEKEAWEICKNLALKSKHKPSTHKCVLRA